MKMQPTWKITIFIIVIVLLVGIWVIQKNKETVDTLVIDTTTMLDELTKTKTTLTETSNSIDPNNRNTYSDPNGQFYFSYSKELGLATESDKNGIYFNSTYDNFAMGSFQMWATTRTEAEENYNSYINSLDDENSTGDYIPDLTSGGWDAEKSLISTNMEGEIPCIRESQGVFRAVFCQIKKIGDNIFLVKYSKDSYKGESTIKEYIIYNKDIRYSFGGGKGLTFVSYSEENPDSNIPQSQEYILGTVKNLRNHTMSRNEILVEDMLSTLTFK